MITSSAHLVELRNRLLVSFGSIFFFAVLSYFFAEHIARFFMAPLFSSQPEVTKLVYTNLTEAFITYLKLSLLIGIFFQIVVRIFGYLEKQGLIPMKSLLVCRMKLILIFLN